MSPVLLVAIFVLVSCVYVFFHELFRMRKEAQAETDEEKVGLICSGLDLAVKMFCFGAFGLTVGLGMALVIHGK